MVADDSTVADATAIMIHRIPWVGTHGYIHLAANAVGNPAESGFSPFPTGEGRLRSRLGRN